MALRRVSATLAVLLLAIALPASAALRVVATFPDLADMTRQIGGERVDVVTIAEGNQDPHKVPVKPSFVTKLNRADAVVVMGLGLEHAFLPPLLEVARNAKIAPGESGYIDASLYVTPLEVPTSQNRTQGELHPLGNPHFNLDPVQGKLMARAIAEGLERVDPDGAQTYQNGLARYTALLDGKIAEWAKLAAPLRGVRAVSYHPDLIYLAERYGIELIGTIETKPGVPATPAHLEELIDAMKQHKTQLVVREVAYELPLAQTVAERTGARVVTISTLTGGLPGTDTYVDFVDANLRALVGALSTAGSP
ncbi:MAG TPA: metal ABC transporter substrate-binding protein [Myxococcota bacterium]|nr:metal ABC transporter substrate-binding protein [Myxococcota bacterium]